MNSFVLGLILGIILMGFTMNMLECVHEEGSLPQPTAMDVYRGRTTLEITYRDSIPIDSVVVFK